MLEEYLKPLRMTQVELARRMGVPLQRVNQLIRGKRGVTAETAVLLSQVLGSTPEFWMNLQSRHDLWFAQKKLGQKGHSTSSPARRAREVRTA